MKEVKKVFVSSLPVGTGFTTGTCAQAAAKASAIMLVSQKLIKEISVETPSEIKLQMKLSDQKIGKDFAQCSVIKHSGYEIDITDKIKIYACVKFSKGKGITIVGGTGIGKVTKPGLAVKVGEYAINPTPRAMITKEVSPYLSKERGLEVTISVPAGEALATKTFNPRLGIVGGISIIGTTGLVEPKSIEAYKTSLLLELNMIKAQGNKKAFLVLGYVGEKFCRQVLNLKQNSIIKIGDFVGFMISECVKKKIEEVYLIGHIGKLIKVTNGQFNTHIKFGDNRLERLSYYAKQFGAEKETIKRISAQACTEAAIGILKEKKLEEVFGAVAKDAVKKLNELSMSKLKINCAILSLKGEVLACYPRNCISLE